VVAASLTFVPLVTTSVVSAAPSATAAAPTLTVPFSYNTTLAGEPLSIEGAFTLTSLTTTSTNVTITGVLAGSATYGDLTLAVNDTVSAIFTPVCGAASASLTVDIGSFDVMLNGFTTTVDPGSFTVTVARDSRVGGLICAVADALADGANTTAIRQLVKLGMNAA